MSKEWMTIMTEDHDDVYGMNDFIIEDHDVYRVSLIMEDNVDISRVFACYERR